MLEFRSICGSLSELFFVTVSKGFVDLSRIVILFALEQLFGKCDSAIEGIAVIFNLDECQGRLKEVAVCLKHVCHHVHAFLSSFGGIEVGLCKFELLLCCFEATFFEESFSSDVALCLHCLGFSFRRIFEVA